MKFVDILMTVGQQVVDSQMKQRGVIGIVFHSGAVVSCNKMAKGSGTHISE